MEDEKRATKSTQKSDKFGSPGKNAFFKYNFANTHKYLRGSCCNVRYLTF